MYLSPFQSSAAAADGKTWVPAHVTAVQNIVQAYADAVNPTLGDNGEISIASKGSVLHGIAPHVERVTAFIARSPIATQRRRLT
jgi:hypothetical protein